MAMLWTLGASTVVIWRRWTSLTPALGVEHEDIDLGAARHGIDRRRAGIARGRADDGQVLASPRAEEFLEQQAEQLQRDILEGQRRPVEQFEQPLLFVELLERRDRLVGEAAIGGAWSVRSRRSGVRLSPTKGCMIRAASSA